MYNALSVYMVNFVCEQFHANPKVYQKLLVICKLQLMEQSCYPLETTYLIIHNTTASQSPITTNKTNVTLYGVRPGETYTVEIIPYIMYREGEPKTFTFS